MKFHMGRFDRAIMSCIKDHGNSQVIAYFFRHADDAVQLLVGMLLSAMVSLVMPYVSLTLFTLVSVPLGLRIMALHLDQFNQFLILGGLVPSAWLLMTAFALKSAMIGNGRSTDTEPVTTPTDPMAIPSLS
jgi:hypothetical protein